VDDVATAAGYNRLGNVSNYAWASCDITSKYSRELFVPLIEQLRSRAVYIIRKVSEVSHGIISKRSDTFNSDLTNINNTDLYPRFTQQVDSLFTDYIEEISQSCVKKSMDEFFNTQTISWELTEFMNNEVQLDLSVTATTPEEIYKQVVNITPAIWKSIRTRITKNIILKFYNFFLLPIRVQLWLVIQEKVNTLSDKELNNYFEVDIIKERLEQDKTHFSTLLEEYNEVEKEFEKLSREFCQTW